MEKEKKVVFPCDLCSKTFTKKSYFIKHRVSHGIVDCDIRKCSTCGECFTSDRSLQRHIMNKHREVRIFICFHCGRRYYSRRTLKSHIAFMHTPKRCNVCARQCSSVYELSSHRKQNHAETYRTLKCFSCDYQGIRTELLHHFEEAHDIVCDIKKYDFNSVEEFEFWKREIETSEKANYVKQRGVKVLVDGTQKYSYYCNRSGESFSRGGGIRKLKIQGFAKSGILCPAVMDAFILENGKVEVIFNSTHLGHKMELAHLRISRHDKNLISEKLAEGYSIQETMGWLQDNFFEEGKINRIDIVTEKDILNRKQSMISKEIPSISPGVKIEGEEVEDFEDVIHEITIVCDETSASEKFEHNLISCLESWEKIKKMNGSHAVPLDAYEGVEKLAQQLSDLSEKLGNA